jgi:hypothetical protein
VAFLAVRMDAPVAPTDQTHLRRIKTAELHSTFCCYLLHLGDSVVEQVSSAVTWLRTSGLCRKLDSTL